jgi:predicted phage tail protein
VTEKQKQLWLHGLRGAFGDTGSGSGGGGGTEDPDTLTSTAYARIKEVLSEGQIAGFADPTNPFRCIALDGTPIQTGDSNATAISATSFTGNTHGTNYTVGDVLTAIGGVFTAPLKVQVDKLGDGDPPGHVASINNGGWHVVDSGAYSVVPPNPVYFSGGTGTGFSLNVSWSTGAPGSAFNFKNFTYFFLPGRIHQSYLPGFDAEEDSIGVGVRLLQAIPWNIRLIDPDLSAMRVDIRFPLLQETDSSSGDIHGTSVSIKIELQSNNGGYQTVITDTISGKASSPYVKTYLVDFAGAPTPPWDIRVTRNTPDSTSEFLKNDTVIDSYTQVIYGRLSHPNSAIMGVEIDAKQFPSIPQRAYLMKGLIVQVPTNYDPVGRNYASTGPGTTNGTWDGTFKLAWTNNPAWCFYDLCTNTRYGLGEFLTGDEISKFDLYGIAQFCDNVDSNGNFVGVPDGFGGFEPRFACSLYLQKREDAFKVVSDMASIFRGLIYYSQGILTPTQDRPRDPDYIFSPANVIDGQFVYSGTSRRARHTVAHVMFSDMTDMGRLKPYVYENAELILKYGYNPLQITAFGCNSAMQARRLGKWSIRVESLLTETLTFRSGQEAFFIRPGMVIQVCDPFRFGADNGGRVVAASPGSITLDRPVGISVGLTHVISVIDPATNLPVTMIVSTVGPGTFTTVAVTGTTVPLPDTLWQFTNVNKPYEFWRVVSMVPKDEGTAEIVCLKYDATIYDGLDDDPLEDPVEIGPTPNPLSFPRVIPPPTNVVIDELVVNREDHVTRSLELSWMDSHAEMLRGYSVLYRYNYGNWKALPETPVAHKSVPVLAPGHFDIQILAINRGGYRSQPVKVSYDYVLGDAPVANPAGGNYAGAVTLTSAVPNAAIYYTLDGSDPTDPTNGNRFVYSGPVTVAYGQTLQAASFSLGHYSGIGSWLFSAAICSAPVFSPVPDPHYPVFGSTPVTLATATAGASIYYTTDPNINVPTAADTLYTGPVPLPAGHTTIKAVAIKAGLANSAVATARYNVRRGTEIAGGANDAPHLADVATRVVVLGRNPTDAPHTAESVIKLP